MTFPRPLAWSEQAECLRYSPKLWDAPTVRELRGSALSRIRTAQEICRGCPVRVPCLELAQAHGMNEGIWGGELITRGKPSSPEAVIAAVTAVRDGSDNCGTYGGYMRHRRIKERICQQCIEARRMQKDIAS